MYIKIFAQFYGVGISFGATCSCPPSKCAAQLLLLQLLLLLLLTWHVLLSQKIASPILLRFSCIMVQLGSVLIAPKSGRTCPTVQCHDCSRNHNNWPSTTISKPLPSFVITASVTRTSCIVATTLHLPATESWTSYFFPYLGGQNEKINLHCRVHSNR